MVKRGKGHTWIGMVLYWAVFLTVTMFIFERGGIHPSVIPGGIIGWGVIVEIPRVIVGFFFGKLFFKEYRLYG